MTWARRVAGCGLLLALAACDPVQDDAIAALGGEAPGVRKGPQHRPGQACLLCHDGGFNHPQEFSVAGTVFLQPTDTRPAQRATVELKGADGSKFEAVTNVVGNFYITPQQLSPAFPLEVSVTFEGERVSMRSNIGRDGSCGGCHMPEVGPASPGQIYVRLEDGGVPP